MKAAYRTQYGPPEVLSVQEQPAPSPAPDEILVRVHASTVNRTDCAGLWGRPFVFRFFTGLRRPTRTATGSDFAGEVLAVGKNVTEFEPGMRVWGFDDTMAGSHAQQFTYSVKKAVARIPDGIGYEQAAASAEGAHYAINFSNKVTLQPGQRVLVNGATGAIGSAAVQFLKNRHAHVTAVCAGEHASRIESLGADRVIDYTVHDFTQEDATYDFVFDAVGKSTFGKCKKVLSRRGIYISSELGPGAENLYLALFSFLSTGKKVIFPLPTDIKGTLARMNDLLTAGMFTPLIDRRYPLEQIREAFAYVDSGQKIGNVILTFD